MVTVSPPVSPTVVARILMSQNPSVTAGTLLATQSVSKYSPSLSDSVGSGLGRGQRLFLIGLLRHQHFPVPAETGGFNLDIRVLPHLCELFIHLRRFVIAVFTMQCLSQSFQRPAVVRMLAQIFTIDDFGFR